jgi:hypothetical protein
MNGTALVYFSLESLKVINRFFDRKHLTFKLIAVNDHCGL